MRVIAGLLFLLQSADYTATGLKALDERRYEDAAQSFAKAIETDPKDYSAHFNLGLAYGFLNKDLEGIAEYSKALELKPGLFEAEMNKGLLLLRQKDSARALPLFEDAARQHPQEFGPRYHLAECQLATGASEEAAASFRMALDINPKSAAVELGLARALTRQQKLGDAAPHFRQAAQLDPTYRDALLELASQYEKANQTAEAIAIYRGFPDAGSVQEHMNQLMLRGEHYADAIPSLEEAYAKNPSPSNLTSLAAAYALTNQTAKALPLLDKATAAQPGNFELRMMYARGLRDSKQYPAAVRQFNEAVKLKADDAKAWSDLAAALYLAGDLQASLGAFDRARQLGEDTAGNYFLRAIILDKLQQMKPAIEAYKRFLDMSHGEHPDQEFQARQRVRIIQTQLEKH